MLRVNLPFVYIRCGFKGHGVHFHLLDHGDESVAARWRKVFAETYIIDEMQVGIEYLVGSVSVENTNKQRNDAFDNNRIAVGREMHTAFLIKRGIKPHAALTTFDKV